MPAVKAILNFLARSILSGVRKAGWKGVEISCKTEESSTVRVGLEQSSLRSFWLAFVQGGEEQAQASVVERSESEAQLARCDVSVWPCIRYGAQQSGVICKVCDLKSRKRLTMSVSGRCLSSSLPSPSLLSVTTYSWPLDSKNWRRPSSFSTQPTGKIQ